MRSRISRHLRFVLDQPPADDGSLDEALTITAPGETPLLPSEFNGRDYAIFLLRIAAEVEHSLMVQYLFAAYSLGGPDVPDDRQRRRARLAGDDPRHRQGGDGAT